MMKYKCLVLDHDDTVVDSTATIHYPCFSEYMKITRPSLSGRYSLSEYFLKSFHPGVVEFFRDEIGMDEAELLREQDYWFDYVKDHIPNAYLGMGDIIAEFRARGGITAVVSHSFKNYIERDYIHSRLPMPDVIYGWDDLPERRKPSPYVLFDIMEKYNLSPKDILVVDDLKPGYDMARSAGVDFAAAGWAYDIPEIENFMRSNCNFYFKTVADFGKAVFEN